MSCQPCSQPSFEAAGTNGGREGQSSDRLEVVIGARVYDQSATAWLLGQGVQYLNSDDKEGELAYRRVVEILQRSDDVLETVQKLGRLARRTDLGRAWSLLYLLGDAGRGDAAPYLAELALQRLPERNEESCEGPRDLEMLLRTMAVEALQRVASRHREVADYVLKVVSAQPEREVLIEAVKAAAELGLRDKVKDILKEEDRWILDIRRARTEELVAEPEREDGRERGFTPPKSGSLRTSPHGGNCTCKES